MGAGVNDYSAGKVNFNKESYSNACPGSGDFGQLTYIAALWVYAVLNLPHPPATNRSEAYISRKDLHI